MNSLNLFTRFYGQAACRDGHGAIMCLPHIEKQSLRLSDLMYHTKQKNGGYFYAEKGLPDGDLLPTVP